MAKFPIDAPIDRVVAALRELGFNEVRRSNHIALERQDGDGTSTPMTSPNHRRLKGSTLRTALVHAGIDRDQFLAAYEESRAMPRRRRMARHVLRWTSTSFTPDCRTIYFVWQ